MVHLENFKEILTAREKINIQVTPVLPNNSAAYLICSKGALSTYFGGISFYPQ